MYKSEKQTIFYVLGLYLSSTLLLIFTLFGSYYFYKLDERTHSEKKILKELSLELEDRLLEVHENSDTKYEYPRFGEFQSAIYDIDKNLIFSNSYFGLEFVGILRKVTTAGEGIVSGSGCGNAAQQQQNKAEPDNCSGCFYS